MCLSVSASGGDPCPETEGGIWGNMERVILIHSQDYEAVVLLKQSITLERGRTPMLITSWFYIVCK